MHPTDEIRGVKTKKLLNKRIVLAVTGSIAAVETIKLARELIRHGASVYPVMSPAATKIINPDSLWFATGFKPIVELTGATEHVSYCGKVENPADLLLICPCTANTISKIARGIDDTSVTTFATTAIGSSVPILIVPAMHISMYDHKMVQKNIEKCKLMGIKFIDPKIEKNVAKMVDIEDVVSYAIREIGKKDLFNKKILIIGGPSSEKIDDVRIITNISSGKTAINLAKNAFFRGADVELLYGQGKEPVPNYIEKIDFESIYDLEKIIKNKNLEKFDVIILCAALSDYIPKKHKGKIKSGKQIYTLELSSAPKIISSLRTKSPKSKIIGFKVEESKTGLKEKAMSLLKKNELDFVVANLISGFSADKNEIWIFDKKGKVLNKKAKKEDLADYILNMIK